MLDSSQERPLADTTTTTAPAPTQGPQTQHASQATDAIAKRVAKLQRSHLQRLQRITSTRVGKTRPANQSASLATAAPNSTSIFQTLDPAVSAVPAAPVAPAAPPRPAAGAGPAASAHAPSTQATAGLQPTPAAAAAGLQPTTAAIAGPQHTAVPRAKNGGQTLAAARLAKAAARRSEEEDEEALERLLDVAHAEVKRMRAAGRAQVAAAMERWHRNGIALFSAFLNREAPPTLPTTLAAPPTAPRPAPTPPQTRAAAPQPKRSYAAAASSGRQPTTTPRPTTAATTRTTAPMAPAPASAKLPTKPPGTGATQDKRVFIRIPEDSPLRRISPHAIAQRIAPAVGPAAVGAISATRTGFAVTPASAAHASGLADACAKIAAQLGPTAAVECAEKWQHVLIAHAPRTLTGFDWEAQKPTSSPITREQMETEVAKAFGAKPMAVRMLRAGERSQPGFGPLLLSFAQSAQISVGTVVMFSTMVRAKLAPRRPRAPQCPRCWLFHSAGRCKSRELCRLCGSPDHPQAAHPQASRTRCAICHGAHPADSPQCPMRPKWDPAREQYRYQDWAAIQRARKAQAELAPPPTPAATRPAAPTPTSAAGATHAARKASSSTPSTSDGVAPPTN